MQILTHSCKSTNASRINGIAKQPNAFPHSVFSMPNLIKMNASSYCHGYPRALSSLLPPTLHSHFINNLPSNHNCTSFIALAFPCRPVKEPTGSELQKLPAEFLQKKNIMEYGYKERVERTAWKTGMYIKGINAPWVLELAPIVEERNHGSLQRIGPSFLIMFSNAIPGTFRPLRAYYNSSRY